MVHHIQYNKVTRLRKATLKKRKEEKTMKNYEINFTTNTITITKKFAQEASQIGTEAFKTMMELRQLGMTINTKEPVQKKNTSLTYDKMKKYIALLEDAEKYQSEFKAVCVESLAMKAPYAYVQKWFKETFPNYGKLPERNEQMKIINTPAHHDAEELKSA